MLISSGGFYFNKKNIDLNIFGKYVSEFENDRFANPADGPQPLGDYFAADINRRIYYNRKNTCQNLLQN